MASKGKKPYVPPQPDDKTFNTQLEFLNSFETSRIPISSLSEDSRRCGFCWKDYGESDPGHDNAEQPIKFRCGHAYGEACMRDLFRMPVLSTIKFRPLDFVPGSSGECLGRDLDMYLRQYTNDFNEKGKSSEKDKACKQEEGGRDLSALPDQIQKVFSTLCNNLMRPGHMSIAHSLYQPWQEALLYILRSQLRIINVMFLGNGIVYDAVERDEDTSPVDHMDHVLGYTTAPNFTPEMLLSAQVGLTPPIVVPPAGIATVNATLADVVAAEIISNTDQAISSQPTPNTNTSNLSPHQLAQLSAIAELETFSDPPQPAPDSPSTGTGTAILDGSAPPSVSKEQEAAELYKKQHAAHAERYRKALTERVDSVASALTKVHADYREYKQQQKGQISSSPSKRPSYTSQLPIPQVIRASVAVHDYNINCRRYIVQEPYGLSSHSPFALGEEDSELDEEEEFDDGADQESQGSDDGEINHGEPKAEEQDTRPRLVVLARTACHGCLQRKEALDPAMKKLKMMKPESISWKSTQKVPNTCPLCSRVLFNKDKRSSRYED